MSATSRFYRMPFGKHQGQQLGSIPIDYLMWLQENVELRDPLKGHVKDEVERRVHEENERERNRQDEQDRKRDRKPRGQRSERSNGNGHQVATLDVGEWFRKMSLEWHPDRRGGSNEGMKALEAGRVLLEEMMAR